VSRGRKARGLAEGEIARLPVHTMKVRHMKKDLFSLKAIRALVVLGAVLALPVSAASAKSSGVLGQGSTSVFATAQGTSLLGTEVPVLGTQGSTLTVPVGTSIVPQSVSNLLDFTVTSEVTVGNVQIYNLYIDPRMSN
jgi:hypothetical protein